MVWLPIIVQVTGVTILNLGTILQKQGADEIPNVHNVPFLQSVKNFITNKPWFIGYLAIMLGTLLTFAVLGFADLSILQPFMGVGIIVQVIFCSWYLKEDVDKNDVVASMVILVGVIFVGLSSREQDQEGFNDTMNMLVAPGALAFQLALLGFSVSCLLYTKWKSWKHADIWITVFSGINSVLSYLYMKVVFTALIEYGLSPALFINGTAWFMLFWAFIISTVSFVSKQVAYQHGRAVLINNIFNAFNIALPVPVGIIVLGEWSDVTPLNGLLQLAGVLTILIGVFFLMMHDMKQKRTCAMETSNVSSEPIPRGEG
ncbi:hypothetical protein GF325_03920 [Candidatus Bathyarchaeota archaeon]|nr:hypothetical protein [Candidatus Bathyarchaeota archaeon]